MQYEMTFETEYDAAAAFTSMGMSRVDRLGFAGITYGDEGERLVTVARKSSETTWTVVEKPARR